jgi:2-iminoacetate synthase
MQTKILWSFKMKNNTIHNESAELIINEPEIFQSMSMQNVFPRAVREIFSKALELKGLDYSDIMPLAKISDPVLLEELFATAKKVKEKIYGKRLVVFAPLYISNLCGNNCLYCAFRAGNKTIKRRALTQDEIAAETAALVKQGHKRLLLVAGESYPGEGFDYIIKSIETVYSVKGTPGEIRRLNVNIAPLTIEDFNVLKDAKIGTYQVFQETYNRDIYKKIHVGGKKMDYNWRITAMDRAMAAGIDDVGIGVLFGLSDWRFEILGLMQHIRHLEKEFGVGPHTISVPRIESASGSEIADHPPFPVNDMDFKKIIAILRLTVPYTGIIMSTRENPELRRETFALGVSQISAGSRTGPGGYSIDDDKTSGQFSLGDHRPLDEVIQDVASLGYIPSFCTACYRMGRTGSDFMDLAKPGEIKHHCDPNAVSTFMEYLLDYMPAEKCASGEKAIQSVIEKMDPVAKKRSLDMSEKIKAGKRDVFC